MLSVGASGMADCNEKIEHAVSCVFRYDSTFHSSSRFSFLESLSMLAGFHGATFAHLLDPGNNSGAYITSQ